MQCLHTHTYIYNKYIYKFYILIIYIKYKYTNKMCVCGGGGRVHIQRCQKKYAYFKKGKNCIKIVYYRNSIQKVIHR